MMRAELHTWGKILVCAAGAGLGAYLLAIGFAGYFDNYGVIGGGRKIEQFSRLIGLGSASVIAAGIATIHWFRR